MNLQKILCTALVVGCALAIWRIDFHLDEAYHRNHTDIFISDEELKAKPNVIERYDWWIYDDKGQVDATEILKTSDGKFSSKEDELTVNEDGTFTIKMKADNEKPERTHRTETKTSDLDKKYNFDRFKFSKNKESLIFINAYDDKYRYKWRSDKRMWEVYKQDKTYD